LHPLYTNHRLYLTTIQTVTKHNGKSQEFRETYPFNRNKENTEPLPGEDGKERSQETEIRNRYGSCRKRPSGSHFPPGQAGEEKRDTQEQGSQPEVEDHEESKQTGRQGESITTAARRLFVKYSGMPPVLHG
jgi:hypothetical protein